MDYIRIVCIGLFILKNLAAHVIENATSNVTDTLEYVLLGNEDPCLRKCIKGSPPMICRYHFGVEWYDTMSKACYDCPYVEEDCFREDCIPADGNKRPVFVINRKMPGPSIQVCQGDEVIVDVENQLVSESTTIHWHGHHQRDTPYMDGVPFVTQCPITPGATFRYQFRAVHPGTHFWHSHTGLQRADGSFGSYIVRVPDEDNPVKDYYDYDLPSHVMILLDWGHVVSLQKFVSHHHNDGDNKPPSLLVNGLGRFKEFSTETNETAYIPTERFHVKRGYRYRFRVINAGFLNCPIKISVDNHSLTVISSDGNDVKPTEAESLVTYAGERWDFVINANQTPDVYWMRFGGLMDCDERFKSAHQVAVLQYDGANSTYPAEDLAYSLIHKPGKEINALNQGTEANETYITVPQLEALQGWDRSLKQKADFQYYVSYDFYKRDNPHFQKAPLYGFNNVSTKKRLLTPQLNYITMKMTPFPLLSQRWQIDESMFCNESTVKNCKEDFCECPHVIKLPLNTVAEVVLIDKGVAYDANHPFHLHGHSFRVVAMEKMGPSVTVQEVYDKDQNGSIVRNLKNPPLKDTVTVPDGGYTIIRFLANNPGYWLFHCHIEFHAEIGMALVFKVGEDSEMPPVPAKFPQCGDYVPIQEPLQPCNDTTFLQKVERYLPRILGGVDCTPQKSGATILAQLNKVLVSLSVILYLLFNY